MSRKNKDTPLCLQQIYSEKRSPNPHTLACPSLQGHVIKEQQARSQLEDMNMLTVMVTFKFSEVCIMVLKQATNTFS